MKDINLLNLPISLDDLFESMPVAMALVSRDGRYIVLNKALASIGGFEVKDLIGKKTCILSKQSLYNSKRDFDFFDKGKEVPDHELKIGEKTYYVSVKPLKDYNGIVIAEMVSLTDITKNKLIEVKYWEANRKLAYHARHDYLTGVLNSRAYYDEAAKLKNSPKNKDSLFAVIFLDLNNFKQINDTFGHQIGDEILIRVAGSIKHVCRKSDLISRLGGDEFSVFINDANKPTVIKIAERIREAIESISLDVNGEVVNVTASIGIAFGDENSKSLREVQDKADKAMYTIKKAREINLP